MLKDRMITSRISCLAALLCVVVFAACKNDDIVSYRAPKEASDGVRPSAGAGGVSEMGSGADLPPPPAAANGGITWRLQKGWKELEPSQMRAGSFVVEGKDGLQADISVVVLAGPAGGELPNINRWRSQLELDAISEAELPRHSKKISPGGRPMLLSNFVSKTPLIDKRYKKRLVAATYARGDDTWFFKMTGEDALIRSLEPSFKEFLAGLTFKDVR